MVYFLYGFYDIFSLTELAYRVLFDIKLPYPSPSVTVSFIGVWITLILIVVLSYKFGVLLAVWVFCKLRTSAESTRTLRFLWHNNYLLFDIKNALGLFQEHLIIFRYYNYITLPYSHSITFTLIYSHLLKILSKLNALS